MKRFTTAVFLILIILTLMGCTTSYKPLSPNNNATPNNTNVSSKDNQAMINKFTRLAESVPGVENAAVAISTTPSAGTYNNNQGTNGVGTINNNPGTNSPNITNYNNFTRTNPNNTYQNNYMGTQDLGSPNTNDMNNNTSTAQPPILRNNYNNTAGTMNNRDMIVMVGITLDSSKNEPNTVTDIAKAVERKIKNSDSSVAQVLVTSNPIGIKKIKNVSNSIMNGTPVKNLQRDINDLTQSISTGNY